MEIKNTPENRELLTLGAAAKLEDGRNKILKALGDLAIQPLRSGRHSEWVTAFTKVKNSCEDVRPAMQILNELQTYERDHRATTATDGPET